MLLPENKESDPHTYQPLSRYDFRYLELLPGSKNDKIRYFLKFGDLRNPPKYEAISYAWGDANTKVPSVCDGQNLETTPSLNEALRHLRNGCYSYLFRTVQR